MRVKNTNDLLRLEETNGCEPWILPRLNDGTWHVTHGPGHPASGPAPGSANRGGPETGGGGPGGDGMDPTGSWSTPVLIHTDGH